MFNCLTNHRFQFMSVQKTLTRCRCGWWRGCCRWGGCCGDFAAVIWNYSGRLFRRNLVISSEKRSYDGSKWWKSLDISFFSASCVCIVKVLSALVSFVLPLLVILNEVMIWTLELHFASKLSWSVFGNSVYLFLWTKRSKTKENTFTCEL